MQAADIRPIPRTDRTQSAFDLFLIFAGANIVATTLQVGASLAPSFDLRSVLVIVAAGSVGGAALVAALAPVGPRLGVPSVIAARAALGRHGAALVAALLVGGNFAWIAVNNTIAASAATTLLGGSVSERWLAFGLGLLATAVVARGPRLVALADRAAVPLMVALVAVLTWAAIRVPIVDAASVRADTPWFRGLDIVIGYQVSWILMFADYSRYTRSEGRSAGAVFFGLALTSLWLMPLGTLAARAAGSADPGAMLRALGLGGSGALLMALATVTTNFVNLYLSALAWKSLQPGVADQPAIWTVGLVGSGLSLLSGRWLDEYASFMLVLGGVLVPVGGLLVARFFLVRRPVVVDALYARTGRTSADIAAFSVPGLVAWIAGALVYYVGAAAGSTVPALLATVVVYVVLDRLIEGQPPRARRA